MIDGLRDTEVTPWWPLAESVLKGKDFISLMLSIIVSISEKPIHTALAPTPGTLSI
jgi:hypothetical protein